ncbi:type III-A CRISPR-associated RAMP protein Csm5 [Succinivibrio sp.]|uniref:type III-A CRISPR-associated RAMP protein Csm5 n=1 Tax=Succinivibrio sp. TaxID=2053619 RepID=UPI0025E1F08D|nr:type III-A CRISPR-associated RAMP protein Csm5 [Succinivibrio sp.]MBQ9222077.1 type III-A CRISPR-associated RAMP protein Csm5 [Succinivibrio sp.]
MSNNLKHYNCTMTVLGPVHIGSGENYRRNEYIYNNRDNSISIMDIGKIYQYFSDKGRASEFESYYSDFRKKSIPLGNWLLSRRITEEQYRNWIKYKMTAGDSIVVLEGGNQTYSDILSFIKDPYSLPYVPGSSIKGMLRTALAIYEIEKMNNRKKLIEPIFSHYEKYSLLLDDKDKKIFKKNNKDTLKRNINRIENEIFNTLSFSNTKNDAVNSSLSRLIVGDSKPLSPDDLTVCKKYDVRPDGKKSEIPIFKECLKPGTKIQFEITIDESMNTQGKKIPYSIEDIKKALKLMNTVISKRFIRHFDPKYDVAPDETIGWLGSCGFTTKTIIQSFYDDSEEDQALKLTQNIFKYNLNNKIYNEHKHNLDISKFNVSPHTRKQTVFDNTRYDFGKVKIDFA